MIESQNPGAMFILESHSCSVRFDGKTNNCGQKEYALGPQKYKDSEKV